MMMVQGARRACSGGCEEQRARQQDCHPSHSCSGGDHDHDEHDGDHAESVDGDDGNNQNV